MGQFARYHLRWIVPARFCIASMVGSTEANIPKHGRTKPRSMRPVAYRTKACRRKRVVAPACSAC